MKIGDLDEDADRRTPRRHSAYDFTKDILPSAISIVGMLLSMNSPWRFIAFLGVALLFGAIGLWPRITEHTHMRREHSKDAVVAKHEAPRFKSFVDRFGDFVDTKTSSSLHYIIGNELSQPLRADFTRQLGTPTIELWYQFWFFFDQRVARQGLVLAELELSVSEFNNMVRQYHNLCVAPVFDRLPKELRSGLTEEDKSKLNGFYYRHRSFMTEYEQFLKTLSASRPSLERLPRYLPTSNPL